VSAFHLLWRNFFGSLHYKSIISFQCYAVLWDDFFIQFLSVLRLMLFSFSSFSISTFWLFNQNFVHEYDFCILFRSWETIKNETLIHASSGSKLEFDEISKYIIGEPWIVASSIKVWVLLFPGLLVLLFSMIFQFLYFGFQLLPEFVFERQSIVYDVFDSQMGNAILL
jgi:hypothetical protein